MNKKILMYETVLRSYKNRKAGIKATQPYKHWFPLSLDYKLAGIVGDLISDGHLQGSPKWRIDFTSKNTDDLDYFNSRIKDVFKVSGKIRSCSTNKYGTYNLGINCKPLARSLNLIGVPSGAKVYQKFGVPSWIYKSKKCSKTFLRRLFTCEGTVDTQGKYVEIQMCKSLDLLEEGITFFKQLQNQLQIHFKIISTQPFTDQRILVTKNGRQSKSIRLKIKRKESVKKFHQHIGFDCPIKMEKLRKIIN